MKKSQKSLNFLIAFSQASKHFDDMILTHEVATAACEYLTSENNKSFCLCEVIRGIRSAVHYHPLAVEKLSVMSRSNGKPFIKIKSQKDRVELPHFYNSR